MQETLGGVDRQWREAAHEGERSFNAHELDDEMAIGEEALQCTRHAHHQHHQRDDDAELFYGISEDVARYGAEQKLGDEPAETRGEDRQRQKKDRSAIL